MTYREAGMTYREAGMTYREAGMTENVPPLTLTLSLQETPGERGI
jgi:hypothetical protein